ncbi:dienelactone hydrolase family protein [Candidatus Bathyarchaeota archaeon]|nr:dienelactone hydrolase family protein [Candidatus Bathyarchaeota archaeon]
MLITLPPQVELNGTVEALQRSEDERGILESRVYFHQLIQEEINAGIPASRIVLGGFSQGGAMSILSGLTAPVKIAGVVGMSSWLLLGQKFKDLATDANKETPVLMCHGTLDPLVVPQLAQVSFQALKGYGYDIKMKTYP